MNLIVDVLLLMKNKKMTNVINISKDKLWDRTPSEFYPTFCFI